MTRSAIDPCFPRRPLRAAATLLATALSACVASGSVDNNTVKQSVVGFALTNAGLYAGIKLDGAKITRIDL